MNEILSAAKQINFIDCQNDNGETPLFKAIIHGHLNCVKALLTERADMKITTNEQVNVLHVAAEYGRTEILQYLLEYDEVITDALLNTVTDGHRIGFGPIHFAVLNNHADCVELLLSKKADIKLRTTCSPYKSSTPLHIAAVKNHVDIAKILLNKDRTTLHEVDGTGWTPIHLAGHYSSRDVMTLLLREGADLSDYTKDSKKYRKTAMDIIINKLPKSANFMKGVFDSCISMNPKTVHGPNYEIAVDYRIFMPKNAQNLEQMKVMRALLKTRNNDAQESLLVHPLVESFLYLKWKALLPSCYSTIALYLTLMICLTALTTSMYFIKDKGNEEPDWLFLLIAPLIMIIFCVIIALLSHVSFASH